ncbi:MAG: EAL domain-containing protein [Nitrospirae bacterium]|nr:EAL domain-containing protein [Nitrospirota bacterium]
MTDKVIKILLVDDDEDDYIMTRDLLSGVEGTHYELQWIKTYDSAVEIIDQKNHDVYLFDYHLGEHTGLELLLQVIKNGCRAPIIMLTGQGDKELDMQAMKTGAADYLVKGHINSPLLERSIRYAIERKRSEEDIYRMAYYDILTNLPNRLLFRDRLKQAIGLAERYNRLGAVMFLDLDNFKRINDTFGHYTGDQLLKSTAERLKNCMRKCDSLSRQNVDDSVDTIARLGGDEFTIILTEIKHIEDSAKVAQRILGSLSEQFVLNDHEIFISASVGIAIYPHDGKDIDSILKNADAAMYHAKAEGKNNYQYYKQSMNASALEKLTMENDLRKALERKEFTLYYQPQIDIAKRKIVGLEALIRWHRTDKTVVLPADFIPLAEETGLIIPISNWVIHTACEQNKAWQAAGFSNIPISVNISNLQFQQKNFVNTIVQVLRDTGLRPGNIILEITESTIMHNADMVFATLYELSCMGLRLTIDDFGTGYSSLSYLKRIPLYSIKIDRSFIKELPDSPDDAAISKAIISMAHSLKLRVVAEGVETEQQLAFLSKQGCDEFQGFLFSRPLPADEIFKLLTGERNGAGLMLSSLHKISEPVQKT